MIALLLKNWRAVGLVLIIGLSLAYGKYYNVAYKATVQELALFKQDVAVLAAKQEAKNVLELVKREAITKNVVFAYSQSVKSLKAHYATNPNTKFIPISVFYPSVDSNPLPPKNDGSAGVSETISGTSEVTTLNLEIAGEEVLQCQALIQWTVEQDKLK